jgi:hypothetical protein
MAKSAHVCMKIAKIIIEGKEKGIISGDMIV